MRKYLNTKFAIYIAKIALCQLARGKLEQPTFVFIRQELEPQKDINTDSLCMYAS